MGQKSSEWKQKNQIQKPANQDYKSKIFKNKPVGIKIQHRKPRTESRKQSSRVRHKVIIPTNGTRTQSNIQNQKLNPRTNQSGLIFQQMKQETIPKRKPNPKTSSKDQKFKIRKQEAPIESKNKPNEG